MKFIVSSSVLYHQLSGINGVITTNPVVPILENFLFEVSEGILVATASDLQTSITTEMPIESKESGNIAVPAKILLETLKNLPEQPVTFNIDESTYSIEISSDNGKYKLAGENATDFPKIPVVADDFSVDMSTEALGRAINNTIFATSNDELRPSMTGVYMSLSATDITFAATDGHRLIRYRRVDVASEQGNSIIIPRKALNLLKATLPVEDTNVSVEFNASNAFFKFGNVKMICRLIDDTFPDYKNVIPVDNNNKIYLNRPEFLNSLKRIAIYANRATNHIKIKITGNELQISAEDIDFANEANERLACEHHGEDVEVGFNAKFLIEMVNNLAVDRILLTLSDTSRAGLLSPLEERENEDLLMLIMPVMLDTYV